jgi:steroid 5-alpha reductase family enzyme
MGLLNLTVIAPFQDTLLLLMVSPLYMTNLTFTADEASLHRTDLLAAALFFFFLVIEMTADEQQYRFQTEKHVLIKLQHQRSGDYQRGFLTSGLFRVSRHANFFAEMCIWWSIYLFSVGSAGWLNWTIIGPFTLTLLFQGSTWLTEVSLLPSH